MEGRWRSVPPPMGADTLTPTAPGAQTGLPAMAFLTAHTLKNKDTPYSPHSSVRGLLKALVSWCCEIATLRFFLRDEGEGRLPFVFENVLLV